MRLSASCCWYHSGDWRTANAAAHRLLATTPATSTDPDEWQFELAEAAQAEGHRLATGGVQSLFLDPIVLHLLELLVRGFARDRLRQDFLHVDHGQFRRR